MALWQVNFLVLPTNVVGDADEMPEEQFLSYVDEDSVFHFNLPSDYENQIQEILPVCTSWHEDLKRWGDDGSDDVQIWSEAGQIASIEVRLDIRKLDDTLLFQILNLVERWSCVLVERRYRMVCRMGVAELRGLLAGHPHNRATKDPRAWLPVLADEVKRIERND